MFHSQVVVLDICKGFQREGFCVLWFVRPYLVIFNEEFSKAFFSESAMCNKSSLYELTNETFGNSLLTSKEEIWKIHRKILNPAFSLGVLKGKIHIFNEKAFELTEELRSIVNNPTEDLQYILKHWTFKIMAESILGLKWNDENHGSGAMNYVKMMDKIMELVIYRLARPWLWWKFLLPYFKPGREYLEIVEDVRHFTYTIILDLQKSLSGKVEQHLDSEDEIRKSLAQILIEQHLKDPTFTIDDIRDHLITFMFGGYDTSSITLMWCIYLLGRNKQVQEKAYKEIESTILGKDVTYSDLGNLKYLECVIKESLRLYPTAPLFGRKLSKEVQCGKYTVPKGTEVIYFTCLLHRNPHVYPKPEVFDPERFYDNTEIRPWMHLPFAEGYRSCIGKKFALMSMKVLLVHILRRFEITTLNKIEDSDLDWAVVLKSVKPARMLFTLRQSHSLGSRTDCLGLRGY